MLCPLHVYLGPEPWKLLPVYTGCRACPPGMSPSAKALKLYTRSRTVSLSQHRSSMKAQQHLQP